MTSYLSRTSALFFPERHPLQRAGSSPAPWPCWATCPCGRRTRGAWGWKGCGRACRGRSSRTDSLRGARSGPACPASSASTWGWRHGPSQSASAREAALGGGLRTALLWRASNGSPSPRPLHSHPWGPLSQAVPESTLREYFGINVPKHATRKGKRDVFLRSKTHNHPLLIRVSSSLNRRTKKAVGPHRCVPCSVELQGNSERLVVRLGRALERPRQRWFPLAESWLAAPGGQCSDTWNQGQAAVGLRAWGPQGAVQLTWKTWPQRYFNW